MLFIFNSILKTNIEVRQRSFEKKNFIELNPTIDRFVCNVHFFRVEMKSSMIFFQR